MSAGLTLINREEVHRVGVQAKRTVVLTSEGHSCRGVCDGDIHVGAE